MGKAVGATVGEIIALIYTRVSTDSQERLGVSLEVQLDQCRHYVVGHGWALDLGNEYTDTLSGRVTERPGYQALLQRVRDLRAAGHRVTVTVAALDRLGRRMLERVRSREELKGLGVATHSIREGGEVSDLVANVLASVAADESERTSARVRETWTHVRGNGWFKVSAMLPWGYTSRPATDAERQAGSPQTVLDVDTKAQPYVRQVFERIASGESTWSVSQWAATLPASVRGAWTCGRGKTTDRELGRRAICKLLRNDVYVAAAPARWPAIIDEITWANVQRRMDATRDAPRAKRCEYRLTGFVYCGICGSRMTGEKSGAYLRYRCQAWRSGGASRPMCNTSVAAPAVEAAVFADVGQRIVAFVGASRPELERAWNALRAPATATAEAARERKRLDRDIAAVKADIANVTREFLKGELPKVAYTVTVQDAEAKLNAAQSRLDKLTAAPTFALPPFAEVLAALSADWSTPLTEVQVLQAREVLAVLVARITPRRRGNGRYAVDIDWTPVGEALAAVSDQAA